MFTSLRLGVMWRTEQLIYYYIKMTWASAVCYCQATWFRVGDRVHLERDCINFNHYIKNTWFYSVFRGEIETKTIFLTFLTFLTVFSSLIWSAMISMYGWRELLIHLNMMQDRIEPKIRETVPTESVIHNCWKAWFSISIVPMESSKSQCLWDTVKARTKR